MNTFAFALISTAIVDESPQQLVDNTKLLDYESNIKEDAYYT